MNNNQIFPVIYRLAKSRDDVYFFTADNGFPDFNAFKIIFPEKFINFGISEANMISFAAGMAGCDNTVFAFAITTFLAIRALEQIRNDICYMKRNVKLIGFGAGLYYSKLGNSHHAIEDIALLNVMPNMTLLCPCNDSEAKDVIKWSSKYNGPVYIRYNIQSMEDDSLPPWKFEFGKGIVIQKGTDATIISTGDILYEVLDATKMLEQMGFSIRIVHMCTVKPIDREQIIESASETKTVITVEEHSVIGGLGSIVGDVILSEGKCDVRFMKMGLNDCFAKGYGQLNDLREMNGLSAEKICQRINQFLKEGSEV